MTVEECKRQIYNATFRNVQRGEPSGDCRGIALSWAWYGSATDLSILGTEVYSILTGAAYCISSRLHRIDIG
jgi:hypothetical protein